jgi:hypothetical protein
MIRSLAASAREAPTTSYYGTPLQMLQRSGRPVLAPPYPSDPFGLLKRQTRFWLSSLGLFNAVNPKLVQQN